MKKTLIILLSLLATCSHAKSPTTIDRVLTKIGSHSNIDVLKNKPQTFNIQGYRPLKNLKNTTDSCANEDKSCQLLKAMEKAKQQLINDLDAYSKSILEGDKMIFDSLGVEIRKTNSPNTLEITLPFIVDKKQDLVLKFNAQIKAQKVDNRITCLPTSSDKNKKDTLVYTSTNKDWVINVKVFHIVQSISEDDTQTLITAYGVIQIRPASACLTVNAYGLQAEVSYQPFYEKDFLKKSSWMNVSDFVKE